MQLDPSGQGWALRVDLVQAGLRGRVCPEVTIRRTQDDWLHTWTDDVEFHADCGPLSLTEAIKTYLAWAAAAAVPGTPRPQL